LEASIILMKPYFAAKLFLNSDAHFFSRFVNSEKKIDLFDIFCRVWLYQVWSEPSAFLSFLGVIFKAHSMVQKETYVLNKLIEYFWKTVNMVFARNVKNLHIKVSQIKF
jgi:hypothetical protein